MSDNTVTAPLPGQHSQSHEEQSQPRRRRIGLYGGSFDPVHQGHLDVATQVRESVGLDEVWLVPALKQPLKGRAHTTALHRVQMLQLAVAAKAGLAVCDVELTRGGPSYTYDTLAELTIKHREVDFGWIIGADSLQTLAAWHRVVSLLQRWPMWVAGRPGVDIESLLAELERQLPSQWAVELTNRLRANVVHTSTADASSTAIRQALAGGQTNPPGLPDVVAGYIRQHALYAGH